MPHLDEPSDMLVLLSRHCDALACPACAAALRLDRDACECVACGRRFGIEAGIPRLFWAPDGDGGSITRRVRAFYDRTPFPDYEEFDDVAALLRKARSGGFAAMLDDAIRPGARVLECGCGTGQLSAFLSLASRSVLAVDMSFSALERGRRFQTAHDLRNVCFAEMNLFQPALRPETFDVVISMGVLHHTADPFLCLRILSRMLRPGGHFVLGLYHRWGRLATHVRRALFRIAGDRFSRLDQEGPRSPANRRRAWVLDQYAHPHESSHTLAEVMKWLPAAGLEFVRAVPRFGSRQPVTAAEQLFVHEPVPPRLRLGTSELAAAWSMHAGAGLFVVVGKKQPREAPDV